MRHDAAGVEEAPPESFKSFWPEVRRSYFFRSKQHYLNFMRSCGGRIYRLQGNGRSIPPFVLVANWRSRGDITALWYLKGWGEERGVLVREAAERSLREGAALFVTRPIGEGEAEEFTKWGFKHLYRIVLLERRPCPVDRESGRREEMEIIHYRKRFREEVLELDATAFDAFWRLDARTLDAVASSCSRNLFLLARAQGQLAGYIIGGANGRFGYLQRLGVRDACQGEGIGEALSRRLIDSLTAMGAGVICVNTQEENRAARSLYRKLGFQELPERRLIMGLAPDLAGWGR